VNSDSSETSSIRRSSIVAPVSASAVTTPAFALGSVIVHSRVRPDAVTSVRPRTSAATARNSAAGLESASVIVAPPPISSRSPSIVSTATSSPSFNTPIRSQTASTCSKM